MIVRLEDVMVVLYERVNTTQRPLFSPQDLHIILKNNWGLRLSNSEIKTEGDAIPLAHLAGAQESIRFISISAYLLRNTKLNSDLRAKHINTLKEILIIFAGSDYTALDNTPALILVYASLLKLLPIEVAPALLERKLPQSEEDLLSMLFAMTDSILFPEFVFDSESQYFKDLPSLRLHLTSDFNQLLEKRLQYNTGFYSNARHYLLVTSQRAHFSRGYDFSHYPLGKAGHNPFIILSNCPIENNPITAIWAWLKQQCTLIPQPGTWQQPTPAPAYTQQCSKYGKDNKVARAGGLLDFGLFVGYNLLKYSTATKDEQLPQPGM